MVERGIGVNWDWRFLNWDLTWVGYYGVERFERRADGSGVGKFLVFLHLTWHGSC